MSGDLSREAIRCALSTTCLGRHLVVVERAESTMDLAASEAEKAAPEGTVVVAEEQTAGRGRFGRSWISPHGVGLYVSILLRLPPEFLSGVNMAATLAVVQAADDIGVPDTEVKWPNDVQVGGRKIAGILVDATTGINTANDLSHVIVGFGLNVSLDIAVYPEIAETATSLEREAAHPVRRLDVLIALLERFEVLYERLKTGESLIHEWKERLNVIGRRVTIEFPGSPRSDLIHGVAMDVDEDSALVVRKDNGSTERLFTGEVSLR